MPATERELSQLLVNIVNESKSCALWSEEHNINNGVVARWVRQISRYQTMQAVVEAVGVRHVMYLGRDEPLCTASC